MRLENYENHENHKISIENKNKKTNHRIQI